MKFEPHTVHRLGGKRKLIAIKFARLEEVIQKNPAIAFRIAVARNKTGDSTLVLDRNLYKLPVTQKTVHPRVIRRRCLAPASITARKTTHTACSAWKRVLSITMFTSELSV